MRATTDMDIDYRMLQGILRSASLQKWMVSLNSLFQMNIDIYVLIWRGWHVSPNPPPPTSLRLGCLYTTQMYFHAIAFVGEVIGTLRASDPDGDRVTYSMFSDYLRVDRETGQVTLQAPLDREVSSCKSFMVV